MRGWERYLHRKCAKKFEVIEYCNWLIKIEIELHPFWTPSLFSHRWVKWSDVPTLTAKNLTFPEPCLISQNLIILWLTSSVVYVLCTSSSVKKVEIELCRLASVLRLHYNESSLMLLSTDEIEHEIGPTIIDVVFKLLINCLEFWISLSSGLMNLPWGNFLMLILHWSKFPSGSPKLKFILQDI